MIHKSSPLFTLRCSLVTCTTDLKSLTCIDDVGLVQGILYLSLVKLSFLFCSFICLVGYSTLVVNKDEYINPRIALHFFAHTCCAWGQKDPIKQIMWSCRTATVRFSITTSSKKKLAPNDCDNDRQPEVAIWPPKPEILIALATLQISDDKIQAYRMH